MKKGFKKRWIAIHEDFMGERLYLSGKNMYPRFFKTKKEVIELGCPEHFCVKVLIPTKYKDKNDW